MQFEPHACFLLHRRPYRESSLLLEVFSSSQGRLGLVARGAAGRRDGWLALLQPFRPLRLGWSQRGELGTLTQAEAGLDDAGVQAGPAGRAGGLPPARLPSGFYLNELLLRLLHRHDAYPELFTAYAAALEGLAGAEDEAPTLRVFEKRLLEALGYGLMLDTPAEGGGLAPERCYLYLREHGPSLAPPSGASGQPVHGATLRALAEERFEDAQSLREAKLLLRFLLAPLLGERPLASRQLFRPL